MDVHQSQLKIFTHLALARTCTVMVALFAGSTPILKMYGRKIFEM